MYFYVQFKCFLYLKRVPNVPAINTWWLEISYIDDVTPVLLQNEKCCYLDKLKN